jgi:hypothetical protein
MRKTFKRKLSIDEVSDMATQGEDISEYLTHKGVMMSPVKTISLNLNQDMVDELDRAALRLTMSRDALIRSLLQQWLDQHQLAEQARKAGRRS